MLIHYLVQTLEHLIPAEPTQIFVQIGEVLISGQQTGYQFDSIAVALVVQIVERYLADYRDAIRQNPNAQRMLLDVLDLFVRAGWPEASKLTYHLEEIFRIVCFRFTWLFDYVRENALISLQVA